MTYHEPMTVIKRDLSGAETWRYTGRVLARAEGMVMLEARFNRDDMPFMDVTLKRDDRFVEWFYTARWYNVFEIHDRDDDAIKGWYCNIGFPAVMEADDCVSYVDLALDLWVAADGAQTVLDADEFEALGLDAETRAAARAALAELQALFRNNQPPF